MLRRVRSAGWDRTALDGAGATHSPQPQYGRVMGSLDLVSLVAEVITWIAFGLRRRVPARRRRSLRLVDGTWLPTDAVVVDGESGRARVRWFAEGEFHAAAPEPRRARARHGPDEQPVFYRRRTPDRLRFEPSPSDPRGCSRRSRSCCSASASSRPSCRSSSRCWAERGASGCRGPRHPSSDAPRGAACVTRARRTSRCRPRCPTR